MVAITPAAMRALDAIRLAGAGGEEKVFGLSESQIARRVKAVARAAGLVLQLQKCGEEFQAASVMAAPGRCLVPSSPPGPPQH